MNKKIFLLPIRSVIFILSFFLISVILQKGFSEILNKTLSDNLPKWLTNKEKDIKMELLNILFKYRQNLAL
jgi:hypothetical protein